MTDNLKEREAFEAWAYDQGYPLRHIHDEADQPYLDLRTEGAWLAFQAGRAALARAQICVPAGWRDLLISLTEHASEASDHTDESFRRGVLYLANRAHKFLAAPPQPQPVQPTTCKHCAGRGFTEKAGYQIPCLCQLSLVDLERALSSIVIAQAKPEQAAKQWMPIETAPKDGTEIIMSNGKDVSAGSWFNGSDGTCDRDGAPNCDDQDAGWMDWSGGMLPEPAHWMPLPAAPQPKD